MGFELDDRELVRLARQDRRGAFASLIERHYPALRSTCRRALGNSDLAGDAAQEATLTALLGLERLRDDERFGSWLIGIGLNVCRSMLRRRGAGTGVIEALADGDAPVAEGGSLLAGICALVLRSGVAGS